MMWTTPYLSDQLAEARMAVNHWRHHAGRPCFGGPAVAVQCIAHNSRVRQQANTPWQGRLLVVDGAGQPRHPRPADRVAVVARATGWSGVRVNGCVRDAPALAALDACPRKYGKQGAGQVDVASGVGGVRFAPGEMVYVDASGMLVPDLAQTACIDAQ